MTAFHAWQRNSNAPASQFCSCTIHLLPGRLKYLLACGSAVVMPESSWAEFW